MDALTINPVEHVDSFRVSDKASELWNWITQWFLSLSERSMGTGWAIAIVMVLFLLLVLGIYLTGWEHVAVGP